MGIKSAIRERYLNHLWKPELQQLFDELGIPIRLSHFPPGSSTWK
jgi:hypothetical protein